MIDYGLIVRRVNAMKKQYGGAHPREILQDLDIALIEMPMGTSPDALKGFIQKNSRMFTVGVNSDLPEEIQDKVLLHEIGHYRQRHLNSFRSGTLGDTSFGYRRDTAELSRFENEANFFAAEYVLDTEESLEAVHAYDLLTAARLLRVPVEFLDYKLRLLHQTGKLETYRDLLAVQSDCMKKMTCTGPDYCDLP